MSARSRKHVMSDDSKGHQSKGCKADTAHHQKITILTVSHGDKLLEHLLNSSSQNTSNSTTANILDKLWGLMASGNALQENRVLTILDILQNVAKNPTQRNLQLDVETVKMSLSIFNDLIPNIPTNSSINANKLLGPTLLESMENIFSSMAAADESFNVSGENVDFFCSALSCEELDGSRAVALQSGASLHLSVTQSNVSSVCYVNALSMTYRPRDQSFSSRYEGEDDTSGSSFLASDIWTYVINAHNVKYNMENISMVIACDNTTCDHTATCVYWNFDHKMWSADGCATKVINGVTNCLCQHLTSFSILMSKFIPGSSKDHDLLNYITTVGLSISIGSLVICMSIQVILLLQIGNCLTSYRQVAILHISVFLLVGHASFLLSGFINSLGKLCVGLTFLTHFSLLAFLSWTLVQGLFLTCRLIFVFHHVTMKEFWTLSMVLGYGCPLVISLGTFLAYFPHRYKRKDVCWLDPQSGALMAYVIPTFLIMLGNLMVLIVVIVKLLRPSVSEGKREDDEVVKKIMKAVLFCTPQFGLTWAIGIPMYFAETSIFLHYIFALLNPLQGFFLLLFGCLLDKKVTEVVRKCFLKNLPPKSSRSYDHQISASHK
ncbi:adhesion G-protein coupled receptor F3-like [Ranitomeya variabilis]|uniref:adhesion G-protein coupled receptor F3-like n=1 Tax=Ranitomeya variabilis TaxID=490064 RepID=UPI00405687CF